MKTAIAFSVVAAFALVAIPGTAGADCMGHKQQLVRSSTPASVAAAPATEAAAPTQTAKVEAATPTSSTPSTQVADLTMTDKVTAVEEE